MRSMMVPSRTFILLVAVWMSAVGPRALAEAAVDFSGVWVLDKAASDSVDAMLKSQGLSYVERLAADNVVVTQTITQDADKVTIHATSAVSDTLEILDLSEKEQQKVSDRFGPALVRTYWSDDRTSLITESKMTLENGRKGLMVIRRRLIDNGQTMRQDLEWTLEGEKPIKIKRILRKKK